MPSTVGIVGAGDFVYTSHLPTLLAMDSVSVAWITDRDPRRVEQVGRSYGINGIPLPEHLGDLPPADIVLLAVPFGVRPAYYDVFRSRQPAIYVEKPLARSVREHQDIASWFPPSALAVGFQRRVWGPVQFVRRFVRDAVFGPLRRMEFRHGGSAVVTSGKAFMSNLAQTGGGVVFEHGIHGLDLCLHISGATSAGPYNVRTLIHKGFDMHAEGDVLLSTSSQEHVTLDFTISWLEDVGEGITFIFERAKLWMSIAEPRVVLKTLDDRVLHTFTDPGDLHPSTGYQTLHRYWVDFLDAIRRKTPNHTSALDSLLTTEIIEQIYARGAQR